MVAPPPTPENRSPQGAFTHIDNESNVSFEDQAWSKKVLGRKLKASCFRDDEQLFDELFRFIHIFFLGGSA